MSDFFVSLLSERSFVAPFEDDYIDVDGEYAQLQLSAVFFIALLMKTGALFPFKIFPEQCFSSFRCHSRCFFCL